MSGFNDAYSASARLVLQDVCSFGLHWSVSLSWHAANINDRESLIPVPYQSIVQDCFMSPRALIETRPQAVRNMVLPYM